MDRSSLPSPLYSWLPLAVLLIHVLEELPGFPAWATARFGTTTTTWFVLSHTPLLALVVLISWRSSRPSRGHRDLWWLLVLLTALCSNGIFHIVTSIIWLEYSPGLISSVVLYLPLTIFLGPKLMRVFGPSSSARAALTGAVIATILTGTLLLDIQLG